MFGKDAFTWPQDCVLCRHYENGGTYKTARHRPHHELCPRKPKPKDKAEEERLRNLKKGLSESEKMKDIRSFGPNYKDHFNNFWLKRKARVAKVRKTYAKESGEEVTETTNLPPIPPSAGMQEPPPQPQESEDEDQRKLPAADVDHEEVVIMEPPMIDWHSVVVAGMKDSQLMKKVDGWKTNCPTPMKIVAQVAAEDLLPKRAFARNGEISEKAQEKLDEALRYFSVENMAMVIPKKKRDGTPVDPYYHIIEGQSLLLVCWDVFYPLVTLPCVHRNDINGVACCGKLKRHRHNWSKNKTLEPIYSFDGPPMWAIVMTYTCEDCGRETKANDPRLLKALPFWVSQTYPVDPKYITPKKNNPWSLHRSASDLLQMLMTTYANGEVVSKLIYRAINQNYETRAAEYFSYHSSIRRDQLER